VVRGVVTDALWDNAITENRTYVRYFRVMVFVRKGVAEKCNGQLHLWAGDAIAPVSIVVYENEFHSGTFQQ